MRELKKTKQFKKDFKKAGRNPRQDTYELNQVIECLLLEGEIDEKYKPHVLIGDWSPLSECHIQRDFLLIYDLTDDDLKLYRCGSHSELFS